MKQNNSAELSGHAFLKIYDKNAPPDPPRPQIQNFARIPYIGIIKPQQYNIILLKIQDTNQQIA